MDVPCVVPVIPVVPHYVLIVPWNALPQELRPGNKDLIRPCELSMFHGFATLL